MDINIVQVYKDIVERQKKRTKAFEKVYVSCENMIRNASKQDLMQCLFRVPDFVLGVPPYNLEECIQYLIARIEKGGFFVQYYFPNVIHISWDIKDLENREKNTGVKLAPLNLEPVSASDMALVDPRKKAKLTKSIIKPSSVGKFQLTLE